MSFDSSDDLDYAEMCLRSADALGDYCRPTCQGAGESCGDDTCGCPCHERAADPAEVLAAARDLVAMVESNAKARGLAHGIPSHILRTLS